MKIEKFTLNSLYDSRLFPAVRIFPRASRKGFSRFVHGMCEYKERYDDFMRFLAENGLIAAAHDHRGHGKSVKEKPISAGLGIKRPARSSRTPCW